MLDTCTLAVLVLMNSAVPISPLEWPALDKVEHLELPLGEAERCRFDRRRFDLSMHRRRLSQPEARSAGEIDDVAEKRLGPQFLGRPVGIGEQVRRSGPVGGRSSAAGLEEGGRLAVARHRGEVDAPERLPRRHEPRPAARGELAVGLGQLDPAPGRAMRRASAVRRCTAGRRSLGAGRSTPGPCARSGGGRRRPAAGRGGGPRSRPDGRPTTPRRRGARGSRRRPSRCRPGRRPRRRRARSGRCRAGRSHRCSSRSRASPTRVGRWARPPRSGHG